MANLPERSLGVYWPYWSSLRLNAVAPEYNTVYLFSARPVGGQPGKSGAVFFDQGNTPFELFVADLKEMRKTRCVLLSIGGAGEYVRLDTRVRSVALVASLSELYDRLGGFDGIDWGFGEQCALPR